ncbi:xylosyltransferase 2 [Clonorchis sinensis]|uniref:protein xylosyltransferase n=1 Tax=Clonorchis sinensis TaxID=79923 RepID=G7Y5L7_CLOSI|nr:xylosyltransferase 2 [Clonorchis sinensis]
MFVYGVVHGPKYGVAMTNERGKPSYEGYSTQKPNESVRSELENLFTTSPTCVCWVNGEKSVGQTLFKQGIRKNGVSSEARILQRKEIKHHGMPFIVHGFKAGNHLGSSSLDALNEGYVQPPSGQPVILGCYAINTDLLSSFMLTESRLDTDCVHLCQQSGVRYAFTTASRMCGCRQQLPSTGSWLPPSACSSPCLLPAHANTSIQRLQFPLCGNQVAIQVTDTASSPPLHKQPDPLSQSTITTPDVVRPVRIVYLLVLHGRSWYQIKRLFRLIFYTRHYYYIHIDARSSYLYQRVRHLSKRYPHNVYVTEKRWVPTWGGTDLLLMMLSAMHHLIVDMGSKWHWDFFINLSGADLPVRPQNQLIAYLSQQRGKIFLHSNPNRPQFIISQGFDRMFASCDQYMWDLGPRPLPTGLILDGGSDWMILPRAFVEYVAFTRDALFNDLLEYFRYSLLPVEMFFHTLAQNTHFCDSVVTHALRFAHWDRPRGCECKYGSVVDWCGCSPVAFRGLRGQQQLCARVGGCLGYQPSDEPVFFARKFDPTVDLEVMEFVVKTMLGKVPYRSTRQFYLENIYSGELEADSTSSLRLIMPAIFEAQLRQLGNLVNISSPITIPSDFHKHLDAFALFNATYQRLSLDEEFPSLRLYPPELVLRAPVLTTASRVAPYSLVLEILLQPPSLLWASEIPVSRIQLGDVIYLEVATMFDGKEQLVRNYPRLLTTMDTLQLIIMWKGEIAAPGRQPRHLSTIAITISPANSHPACVGHSTLSLVSPKSVMLSAIRRRISAEPQQYSNCVKRYQKQSKLLYSSPGRLELVIRIILVSSVYEKLVPFKKTQIIDPRPLDSTLPLELVHYRETFLELCRNFSKCDENCCTLILLGQKYGLPLLPLEIPKAVFERIEEHMRSKRHNPHWKTLNKTDLRFWYELDDNCLPTSKWVLRPLENLIPSIKSNVSSGGAIAYVYLHNKLGLIRNAVRKKYSDGYLKRKVLWRKPNGLEREFHRDYLEEFAKNISTALKESIDIRARRKLKVLFSNLSSVPTPKEALPESPSTTSQQSNSTTSIYLSEEPNSRLRRSRDLQRRLRTWDQAWNSVTHLRAAGYLGQPYPEEVQAILNYLEDTSEESEVPLLVSQEPGLADESSVDFASAVAAEAFIQIQERRKSSNGIILLGRVLTETTMISTFLENLSLQLSFALGMNEEHFDKSSFSSWISSVSSVLSAHNGEKSVFLVLAGIEHISETYRTEFDATRAPLLLTPTQFPSHLGPGIKLVLASRLNTNENYLPSTCLQIWMKKLTSICHSFSACMVALNKQNRRLTDLQMIAVHDALRSLEEVPTVLYTATEIGMQLLSKVRSCDTLSCESILEWVRLPRQTTFADKYCIWFGKETIEECFSFLHLSTSASWEHLGLTNEEMEDLLTLNERVMRAEFQKDHRPESNSVFFDPAVWFLIRSEINRSVTLFVDQGVRAIDGYFTQKLDALVTEYPTQRAAETMSDYFSGAWNGTHKELFPLDGNSIKATTVAKQGVCYVHAEMSQFPDYQGLEFNIRFIRHSFFALLHASRFMLIGTRILFNFSWLHGALLALGIDFVLHCFDTFEQRASSFSVETGIPSPMLIQLRLESELLTIALIRSRCTLDTHPEMLPTELIGQLLPFARISRSASQDRMGIWTAQLLRDCERAVGLHSILVPIHSFPLVPTNPLLKQVTCATPLSNMFVHRGSQIFIKLCNDSKVYRYDFRTNSRLTDCETSPGKLFSSPNGQFGVIVDENTGGYVNVYQLDVDIDREIPLLGQINIEFWIAAGLTGNPDSKPLHVSILDVDITNTHVAFLCKTKDILFQFEVTDPESGAPGRIPDFVEIKEILENKTINHIAIFELATGKPVKILGAFPKADFVKLVPASMLSVCGNSSSGKGEEQAEDPVFLVNSGEQVLCLRTVSGEQLFSIDLGAVSKKCLFSPVSCVMFILCDKVSTIIRMQLEPTGRLHKSQKISFQNVLDSELIEDIKPSNCLPLLLIRNEKCILVYDYEAETLACRVNRPKHIPQQFRLPNSEHQKLCFTAAAFALGDQIVVAAVFRHVILWDIRSDTPLAMLNAPITVVTDLLVIDSGRQLIGYGALKHELYMWDLPLALAQSSLMQNVYGTYSGNANRMDCLTCPPKEIVVSPKLDRVLVRCLQSDEVGVFNPATGRLLDLYTHDHVVSSVLVSACGQYAFVGLDRETDSKPALVNLVWSLETRHLLLEYGEVSGYHLAPHKQPCTFFQLIPSDELETFTMVLDENSYNLLRLCIQTSSDAQMYVCIRPVENVLIPEVYQHSKPFITSDDQYLIALVYQKRENQNSNEQSTCAVAITSLCETDSYVWYITAEMLTAQSFDSLSINNILSCAPVQFGSDVLLLMCTDIAPFSMDCENAVCVNRFLSLVQFSPKSDQIIILRMITEVSLESSVTSFYLSPTGSALYEETQCSIYRFPASTENSVVRLSQDAEVLSINSRIQSKQALHFRGFVCNDLLCVFSVASLMYLIKLTPFEVVAMVDVHHLISTTVVAGTTNNLIFVGSAEGYLLSFFISDPNNVESNLREINRLRKLSSPLKTCTLYESMSEDKSERNVFVRSRTWDRELGEQKYLDDSEDSEIFTASEMSRLCGALLGPNLPDSMGDKMWWARKKPAKRLNTAAMESSNEVEFGVDWLSTNYEKTYNRKNPAGAQLVFGKPSINRQPIVQKL